MRGEHTLPGALQVFRRLYDAVGLGWVYAITRLPLIGRLADACALTGSLPIRVEVVLGALISSWRKQYCIQRSWWSDIQCLTKRRSAHGAGRVYAFLAKLRILAKQLME